MTRRNVAELVDSLTVARAKREVTNPYQSLLAIGAEIDHHESDLYVKETPEVMAIIDASGWTWQRFISQIDGCPWIDVAFAFAPFWQAKQRA